VCAVLELTLSETSRAKQCLRLPNISAS
jgi:hypothetical protein